jgi:hypothetical protein
MSVCYFIAQKRVGEAPYCDAGFKVQAKGSEVVVTPDSDGGTTALMGGRETFLRYIDELAARLQNAYE